MSIRRFVMLRFVMLIILTVLAIINVNGRALAISYEFRYDNSVSEARNKVARYAYEIFNYRWVTGGTIKLHKKLDYRYDGTEIRGIPYTLSTQVTFARYKQMIQEYRNGSDNGLYELNSEGISMEYGMACAEFVTDCLKQGFPSDANVGNDGATCFHFHYYSDGKFRGNWYKYVTSVSDTIYSFTNSDDGYEYAWNTEFRQKVQDNDYEAYKKLKRGDYLFNYDHVVLVIDNDKNSQTITYIDQTPYWDANNDVGTHIGTRDYSTFGADYKYGYRYKYIPMYVNYPDDPDDDKLDDFNDDLPWDGAQILIGLTYDHFAKTYTLENKRYDVYADKLFRYKLAENWTDGSEEDYILGVGKNSEGNDYARVSIPTSSGRKIVYAKLHDVFVQGNINLGMPIYYDSDKFYRRRGSDPDSSYKVHPDDGYIFPLTEDNEWVQIAFWDSGDNGGTRIAWLKHDEYMRITTPPDVGIKINDLSRFPDVNFRLFIYKELDQNQDGYLTASEIANVTQIKAGGRNLRDLTGIKLFTNLSWLECQDNKIKNLDLSGMTKLTSVWAWNNEMESVNVSGCTELPELWVYDNKLTVLNVSNCAKLKRISAWNNSFTTLTIKNMSALEYFNIAGAKSLTELDIYGNTNLKELHLNDCVSMKSLICQNNALTTLNVANCQSLAGIYAKGNSNLKTFSLNGCTNLEVLDRDSNVLVPGTAPKITTTTLPDATVRADYNATIRATGTAPIRYSFNSLASSIGFAINEKTGQITGKPTNIRDSLSIVVTAKNYVNSDTKTFSIKINPSVLSPTITTDNSQIDAVGGYPFNFSIEATGNTPITWKISDGSLPPGLSFNKSGSTGSKVEISGTPDKNGRDDWSSHSFEVSATNSGGTSKRTFSINVFDQPVITTNNILKSVYVNEDDYTAELSATGTRYGMTWKVKSGSVLPSGLKLESSTGTYGSRTASITGKPTQAGTYSFTLVLSAGRQVLVGLSPAAGMSTEKTFTITVNSRPLPTGVAINSTSFPDSVFRKYVTDNFDKDSNGYLSDSEIAAVTSINIKDRNISNLKGIEVFTKLEELACENNNLTALDISKNSNLTALYCSSNKLTSLNLSNNKKLEILECDSNQLTELTLSNNTALESLSCTGNTLTKLDVSGKSKLKYLDCNDNELTELILGDNSVLEEVNCANNPSLKEVNISGCTKLSSNNVTIDSGAKLVTEKGTETPEIDGDDETPEFGSSTLILDGKIGINFYVYIPETYNPENCYMTFESRRGISNEEPTQKYNPEFFSIRNGKKYYAYTCYINSAQMAEDVTATFHFNGGTKSKTDSVDAYLTLAHKHEDMFSDNVNNLMKAIRNYGHYVQPMLAINGNWTIGYRYAEMARASEITDADIAETRAQIAQYAKVEYKNSVGITRNISYSLNLDSDTVLNISFLPLSTYNGSVSISVDGKTYNAEKSNENGTTKYKIEISNISAPDLGKTFSVTAEANGINMVNISALSYAHAVLNSTATQIGSVPIGVMNQAVTALYRYYAAAKAYMDGGKK